MKNRHLPLNALRAFEAAARLGRQTAAADELGVTHGAVSRQIRQLENFIGADLFEGPRNNQALTPLGQTMLPALTSAFDALHGVMRQARGESSTVLNVACLSTLAMRWLIPRLKDFHQSCPNIHVRLSTDERRMGDMQGRIDLSITVLDAGTRPHAADIKLFAEELGVVIAPALVKDKAIHALRDLGKVPQISAVTRPNAWPAWLAMSAGQIVGQIVGQAGRNAGSQAEGQAEGQAGSKGGELADAASRPGRVASVSWSSQPISYEHYSFAIEAAASGLGACVAPRHLVEDDIEAGRLAAPFGFVATGYHYIARHQRPPGAAALKFCQWLQQAALPQIWPQAGRAGAAPGSQSVA